MPNQQQGITHFTSIRIFFDIEECRILFHNGDIDHFTAVYNSDKHQIIVKYFGEDSIRSYVTTAPLHIKDNIEAWLYDPNIAIDIEGTTGKLYDERKKEMFELMKNRNKNQNDSRI